MIAAFLCALLTLAQPNCPNGQCPLERRVNNGSVVIVNPTAAQAPVIYRQMEAPSAPCNRLELQSKQPLRNVARVIVRAVVRR